MANFSNPVSTELSPERIDMGVDYGGAGPLYALGNGTVANVSNSGWPGGTFLTIHLDDTGDYIYYAEDVNPLVSVGQRVTAGQHIADATGGASGIEVGWAAPPGTGQAMAAAAGQDASGLSASGDPGEYSTAYGVAMSNLIAALGGKPGLVNNPVQGTVPSSFLSALSTAIGKALTDVPTSASAAATSAESGSSGGLLSIPTQITSFFTDADKFVSALLWIVQPSSWLRIGSFLVGIILLLLAGYAFVRVSSGESLIPQTIPAPVPVPV